MQNAASVKKPISEKIKAFASRHRLLAVLAVVMVVVSVVTCTFLLIYFNKNSSVPLTADPVEKVEEPDADAPRSILAVTLKVEDFSSDDWQTQVESKITKAYDSGFNCIVVQSLSSGKAIYKSSIFESLDGNDYLRYIIDTAHKKAMLVFVKADPLAMPDSSNQYNICSDSSVTESSNEISYLCLSYGADGVILAPSELDKNNPTYSDYTANGGSMGYEEFAGLMLGKFVGRVAKEVRISGGGVCVGASVPLNDFENSKTWAEDGALDFVEVVSDFTALEDFKAYADSWIDSAEDGVEVYFNMPSSKVDTENTVSMLCQQCDYLVERANTGFIFDSFNVVDKADTDFAELTALLASITDEEYGIRTLTVQSPSSHDFSTYSDTVSFIGSSDPNYPLTLNGKDVERTATGYFTLTLKLEAGKNTFVFAHKETSETYTVTYNKVLIKSIYPSEEVYYDGGVSVTVGVIAYNGCTVKARLGNQVVDMVGGAAATNDVSESFVSFTAEFTMPEADVVPIEVGELIITAVRNGESETKAGGKIIVRAKDTTSSVTSGTASSVYESGYGIQVGVGDRYVAEVATYQTETLDIITPTDERSRPTNAYLPQGTVDYCSDTDIVFNNPESGNTNSFRNLDYGKRVYSDENIKIFKATLPETNTVTAVDTVNNGRHTVITFDVAWKAPFNVTLAPQSYADPYPKSGRPDYSVTSTTYQYIDLEFCYTVSGQGKVELGDNPVFSKAEWIKCESGNYALRLWLKQEGMFYGWIAQYNEDNQLEFYFLNPYQATESVNSYGYSLEGAVIVVDAGHGGGDVGAVGSSSQYTEAVLNLMLAKKIQRELENLGATVIMTRTDNTTVSLDERTKQTDEVMPDLFISVHRNASTSTSARGYENYYFSPFSKALADSVYERVKGDFTVDRGVQFYPFYVTRVSCCPSILTENGFVTNSEDLEMIKADSHNEALAKHTVEGIVDYFASIKQ